MSIYMTIQGSEPRTSPFTIVFAWLFVAIPLGWGVYESAVKSLPLFQPSQVKR
jgi:hypothetical protein